MFQYKRMLSSRDNENARKLDFSDYVKLECFFADLLSLEEGIRLY